MKLKPAANIMIALLVLVIGAGTISCGCVSMTAEAKGLHHSMPMPGQDHCEDHDTHRSGDTAAPLHVQREPVASASGPVPDASHFLASIAPGVPQGYVRLDASFGNYRDPPFLKPFTPVSLRVLMLN